MGVIFTLKEQKAAWPALRESVFHAGKTGCFVSEFP